MHLFPHTHLHIRKVHILTALILTQWVARFVGRYNVMICFMYRPSPQIPRPSVEAAKKCFDASEFNIYMQRKHIETKSVELTWVFSATIFMAINTILWTLSYSEIRRLHPREKVEELLSISLDGICLASERWPGVASAHELYLSLVGSCLKVYDMDGDLPVTAISPEGTSSPESTQSQHRSRTESPATLSMHSHVTTPEYGGTQQAYPRQANLGLGGDNLYEPNAPLHELQSSHGIEFGRHTLAPLRTNPHAPNTMQFPGAMSTPSTTDSIHTPQSYELANPRPTVALDSASVAHGQSFRPVLKPVPPPTFSSGAPWDHPIEGPVDDFGGTIQCPLPSVDSFNVKDERFNNLCLYPQYSMYLDPEQYGLEQAQQTELLHTLETTGVGNLDKMIGASSAMLHAPQPPRQPS